MRILSKEIVETFNSWIQDRLSTVHTCMPGEFESYGGHRERLAVVKPAIKMLTPTGEELSIPPIQNVPVIFPGTSEASMLFPINKGDGCLLLFSEVGIGRWMDARGEIAQDDLAHHNLTDAIAIPGLFQKSKIPQVDAPANAFVINFKNNKVVLDGDDFSIEGNASSIASSGGTITMNSMEIDA